VGVMGVTIAVAIPVNRVFFIGVPPIYVFMDIL